MAQYNVTHVCGHDHTHRLFGPTRQREWRLTRLEVESCPGCASAARVAAREAENAKAAEAAKAAGLPTLTGSEKQIAWAETVRETLVREVGCVLVGLEQYPELRDLVTDANPADATHIGAIADRCEELVSDVGEDEVTTGSTLHAYLTILIGRTDAKWWIDSRNSLGFRGLADLVKREEKEAEDRRAKSLAAEEVNEFRESVRRRIAEIFPGFGNWELKVGTWSGCKRVYFGS